MDDADDTSPWASDAPVAPAIEFDVGSADPTPPEGDDKPEHPSNMSIRLALGALLLVGTIGLIAVTVALFGGDGDTDEASTEAPGTTSTSEELSYGNMAAPPTTRIPTSAPIDTPANTTTNATNTTTNAPDDDAAAAPSIGTADADPDDDLLPGLWVDGEIDLPEPLGQLTAPTELVVLDRSGTITTIDLATGSTRSFDLGMTTVDYRVHLGRTAVLLESNTGSASTSLVVTPGEQPVIVDLTDHDNLFVSRESTLSDTFEARAYDISSGEERAVTIGADGSVDASEVDDEVYYDAGPMVTGERLAFDAGGTYLVADDGTARRISSGEVIGRTPSVLLVRECDEQRRCENVLIDLVTGERTAAVVSDSFSPAQRILSLAELSPDGRWLLYVTGPNGAPTVADLTTGTDLELPITAFDQYGERTVAWSPDSIGLFAVEDGAVVYVDRTTGELTEVLSPPDDEITFVDLGVRPVPE